MHIRCYQQVPGFVDSDGVEAFSDTLGKGRKTAHEHRHIGAQTQPDFSEPIDIQTKLPERIQRMQGGGRIGTAAAQPGTDGYSFTNADFHASAGSCQALKYSRTAHHQVVIGSDE